MPEGRTGENEPLGPTYTAIFDADGDAGRPCSTIMVRCLAGGDDVLVRINGLHGAVGARILAGEREYFRYGKNEIRRVDARSAATSSTIDWGPTAST
jgi:hypothetical protein